MLKIAPIDDPSPFAELCTLAKADLVIGAWWNSYPVGVLSATFSPVISKGQIEHVCVHPSYRQHGVAAALVEKAEHLLKEKGYAVVVWSYETQDPFAKDIEDVLLSRSWHSPQLLLRRYRIDTYTLHPKWFENAPVLPSDTTEFPWIELTASERRRIEIHIAQGAIPASVSPFGPDENTIEPINSIGLHFQGKVVGWMVTHRLSPDTIKYSGLYIDRDYRHRGIVVRLLVDSIKLQQQSPVQYASFEINPELVSASWLRFIALRLAPYALDIQTMNTSWKGLFPTDASTT